MNVYSVYFVEISVKSKENNSSKPEYRYTFCYNDSYSDSIFIELRTYGGQGSFTFDPSGYCYDFAGMGTARIINMIGGLSYDQHIRLLKARDVIREEPLNYHLGTSFDEFLMEEGILEECQSVASQRIEEYLTQKGNNNS